MWNCPRSHRESQGTGRYHWSHLGSPREDESRAKGTAHATLQAIQRAGRGGRKAGRAGSCLGAGELENMASSQGRPSPSLSQEGGWLGPLLTPSFLLRRCCDFRHVGGLWQFPSLCKEAKETMGKVSHRRDPGQFAPRSQAGSAPP